MAEVPGNGSAALTGQASLSRLSDARPELANVEQVWRESLEPKLAKRESKRRRIVREAWRKTGVGASISVGAYLVLLVLTRGGFGALFPMFLFGGIVIVAAVSGFSWLRVYSMKTQTKDLILSEACNLFGFSYDTLHPDVSEISDLKSLAANVPMLMEKYAGEKRGETKEIKTPFGPLKVDSYSADGPAPPTPAYDIMNDASLIEAHSTRRFEDLIQGERAGAKFSLVEAKLHSGGDSKEEVFEGILVHIEYPEPFLGRTYIARKGWRSWFGGPKGMQKIDLVSDELNDAFTVYSTDQVEARALLTPDRMERLIALERHFSGAKLRAVFEAGHMTIALEAEDQFEAGSIMKTLIDPQRFVSALVELGLVCDLIDGFLTRDWINKKA